jgi:hypothetical protein
VAPEAEADPEGGIDLEVQVPDVTGPVVQEQRREMAGTGHADLRERRVDDAVEDRGHLPGLEVLELVVEAAEDLGRIGGLDRVRPERAAHPAHHDRRRQPVPGHVPDHQAEAAAAEAEDVVPVAAHRPTGSGHVASSEAEAGHLRKPGGHEAPLERHCRLPLDGGETGPGGAGDPLGDHLEELDLVVGERPGGEAADVEDADHVSTVQERHPGHRVDALRDQERVDHGRLVDPIDHPGRPLGRDVPGEAPAQRNPHALTHLFLDAAGGGGDQLARLGVEEEDGGRVDVQDLTDPLQQLVEQLFDVQERERRVGDGLDLAEAFLWCRLIGRGRCAHPPTPLLVPPTLTPTRPVSGACPPIEGEERSSDQGVSPPGGPPLQTRSIRRDSRKPR